MAIYFTGPCRPAALLVLALSLYGCKSTTTDPIAAATPTEADYIFSGNPGIPTTQFYESGGSLTGSIGTKPLDLGPGKESSLRALFYHGYTVGPVTVGPTALLVLEAQNTQFRVTASIGGPFEVGTYDNVNVIEEPPYTVPKPEAGYDYDKPKAVNVVFSSPPDKRTTPPWKVEYYPTREKTVRITAISPDWIEGDISFTLKKAGSTPERLSFRIKNQLNGNANLKAASATDPFWDYTKVRRAVDQTTFNADSAIYGFNFVPGVKYEVYVPSPSGYTQVTREGTTDEYKRQLAVQYLPTAYSKNRTFQIFMSGSSSSSDALFARGTDLTFTNFKGVGTYEGGDVRLRYYEGTSGVAGYSWDVSTDQYKTPGPKWQVIVTRVTPDVIEGTYSLDKAPRTDRYGTPPPGTLPALVSLSGKFKVIYPR